MKKIGKLFLQGLIAILPIALTLYLIYWLAATAESVLGQAIRFVFKDYYRPGLGVLAGFLLTLGVGILLRIWVFRKIFSLASISTVLETANKSCQRGGWWSGEGEAEPLVSKPGHGGGLIGQP